MTMTRELMSELELIVPDLTDAACSGMDGDMFYDDMTVHESVTEYGYYTSTAPKQHAMLRRVCANCPVKIECAEFAIKHERFGFWGGLTAMERHSIRTMNNILLEEITYDVPVNIIRNMNGDDEDEQ
jgi:WhiB family redox-sensing transcriptional regulator